MPRSKALDGIIANQTDPAAPSIQSPITFLVVNFIHFYAVLIIAIAIYSLYIRPNKTEKSSSNEYELNNVDFDGGGGGDDGVTTTTTEGSDQERPDAFSSSRVRHHTTNSYDPIDGRKSWSGDWNEYWNNKRDY